MRRSGSFVLDAAFALLAAFVLLATSASAGDAVPRHELRVTLDPAAHRVSVEDEVLLPSGGPAEVDFLLNAVFRVTRSSPAVR
jgi:hypothetical protein